MRKTIILALFITFILAQKIEFKQQRVVFESRDTLTNKLNWKEIILTSNKNIQYKTKIDDSLLLLKPNDELTDSCKKWIRVKYSER